MYSIPFLLRIRILVYKVVFSSEIREQISVIQAFTIVYQPPIVEGLNVISNNRRQSQEKNYLGECADFDVTIGRWGNIAQESSGNNFL